MPSFPYTVTRPLQERLLSMYPALQGSALRSFGLRAIAGYALYGPLDLDEEGVRSLLFTRQMLADWLKRHPNDDAVVAKNWIRAFNTQVFPLNATRWDYQRRQARRIRPQIPEVILMLRDQSLRLDLDGSPPDRMDFLSGEALSRRRQQARRAEYSSATQGELKITPAHPAYELALFLNQQSPVTLNRILMRNWTDVVGAAMKLAPSPTREAGIRALAAIQECRIMVYDVSGRTPRIHTRGPTIHQLPRELRKRALRGCTSLDLRCSQLAIAARVWDIGPIRSFLEAGGAIWEELLGHLRLDPSHKPLLKRALYSTVYGMRPANIHRLLTGRPGGLDGIDRDQADRFMRHPLIEALLAARNYALAAARNRHGLLDAFGRWIPLTPEVDDRSVVAQQLQSHELAVMASALPILKKGDLYVVSWLHDGVTLHCSDATKLERRMAQVAAAINREASSRGFCTEVEHECL